MYQPLRPPEPGQKVMGHHAGPLDWRTGSTHSPRTAFVRLPPDHGPLMGHLAPRRASSVIEATPPNRAIKREEPQP